MRFAFEDPPLHGTRELHDTEYGKTERDHALLCLCRQRETKTCTLQMLSSFSYNGGFGLPGTYYYAVTSMTPVRSFFSARLDDLNHDSVTAV